MTGVRVRVLECDNRWQSNFTEDCVGDVERYISVV